MQDSHDSTQPGGGAAARRGGRGAPLKPLVDTSPLAGTAPNAGVRIGLLLRLHRFCDGHGRYPRQADMLEALLEAGHHATTTALSRAESGTHRSSAIMRGYEDVLGLPDGSLRAVADFLCRRHPASPPDRDPVQSDLDVHNLSSLTAAVQRDDPRPSDWYTFARAFRRPDTLGLPVETMGRIAKRLCGTLRTSGGVAWTMSLESMLLLAEGPYVEVVRETARDCPPLMVALRNPVARATATPGGRAGNEGGPAGRAANEPSGPAGRGANESGPGGRPVNEGGPGGRAANEVSGPGGRAANEVSGQSRPPRLPADTPTKDRRNLEWTWSHQASLTLTSAHHLPEQPVVDRLLYDVLADPSEDRALDAGVTLAALPFAEDAINVLRRAATTYPHEGRRERLARRLEQGWAR